MKLGLFEFKKKLSSIPKDEPLYEIIKSRTINIGKIKNKEEKDYLKYIWLDLKRVNEIPQIYLTTKEIDSMLSEFTKNKKI